MVGGSAVAVKIRTDLRASTTPGVGTTPAFPTLRSQYPPQTRLSALGPRRLQA